MRIQRTWGLVGIGILSVLVAFSPFVLHNLPNPGLTYQENPEPVAQSPVPSQNSPLLPLVEPTWTPIPTWTPKPTPTRRPGSIETPVTLPTKPADASGIIRYTSAIGEGDRIVYSHWTLVVDGQGKPISNPDPEPIPTELGFVPDKIFVSPTGKYVVYLQPVEPDGRPFIYNRVTRKIQTLFENYSGGSFYNWHPDGRRFLFWIDMVGLMLIDAETLDTVTLSYPPSVVQGAAISSDGLAVAYIVDASPSLEALWFVSAAGGNAKPILDAAGGYLYSSAWSPDSVRLLYQGNCLGSVPKEEQSAYGLLCLFDLKTQTQQPLKLPFMEYAPVWSPNGRYLAATGVTPGENSCILSPISQVDLEKCRYKARSIYLLDLQTGESIILTSGIAPVWSPDGSMLAFLSNKSGNSEIWTVRPNGSALRQLTADGLWKSSTLAWAPTKNESK